MDGVSWRITIDGFSRREDARKIAALLKRAAVDNTPEGDTIRIEVHGYTHPEAAE